jgi:hypothetical protein
MDWKNLEKKIKETKSTDVTGARFKFLFPGIKAGSTTPKQLKIRIVSEPCSAMVHWVGATAEGCPFVVCTRYDVVSGEMNEDEVCILCRQRNRPRMIHFAIVRDLKSDDKPLCIFPFTDDLLKMMLSTLKTLANVNEYVIVIVSKRDRSNLRRIEYSIKAEKSKVKYPPEIYEEAEKMLNEFKKYLGFPVEKSKIKVMREKAESIEEEQMEAEEEEELVEEKDLGEDEDEPFPKRKSISEEDEEIKEEDIEDIDDLDE